MDQRIAHSGRKDVNATYMEHIITPSQNTETKARPPAGARPCSQNTTDIVGAIAHQRLCLLDEVSIPELAHGTLGEREGSPGFRFDQLDGHRPLRVKVQSS